MLSNIKFNIVKKYKRFFNLAKLHNNFKNISTLQHLYADRKQLS